MPATFDVGRRKTHCPRCDKPLAPVKSGGASLVGCGTCRGVWVDRKMFGQIGATDLKARKLGAARWARGNGIKAAQRIKCPICYYWMDATDFEKCPDLVVDVCRRHGTWLDANELQSMLRFLKEGKTAPLPAIEPAKLIAVPRSGLNLAGATAVAGAASVAAANHQDRSSFEGAGEVVFELLEIVGEFADAGEIATGVAEIGFSLFSGL